MNQSAVLKDTGTSKVRRVRGEGHTGARKIWNHAGRPVPNGEETKPPRESGTNTRRQRNFSGARSRKSVEDPSEKRATTSDDLGNKR
jgi:hypothetical protein